MLSPSSIQKIISNTSRSRSLLLHSMCVVHNLSPFQKTKHQAAAATYFQQLRWSGHSKWQNIRHIKAAKDYEKSKVSNELISKLRLAVKEGGSADPKVNHKLVQILEMGKKKNIPSSTLTEALKKLTLLKDQGKQVFYEARGPGNVAVIFDVYTDRPRYIWAELQNQLRRSSGCLGEKGFASFAFNYKGVVVCPKTDELTYEKAEELAILAEAEEVEEMEEADGTFYNFYCDASQLFLVKRNLQAQRLHVDHHRQIYIPKQFAELTDSQMQELTKLYERLEAFDEIEHIYDNARTSQS